MNLLGLALLVTLTFPADAAHIVLSNGQGCEFTAFQVAPDGNITVQCVDTLPIEPPPVVIPPVVTKCSAVPYTKVALAWGAPPLQHRMASGQVSAFPIPAPLAGARSSVVLSQGQQAVSPSTTTEMTISKCPGVITAAVPQCYLKMTTNNLVNITAFTRPVSVEIRDVIVVWNSQATFGFRGCWTPIAEGPWYVNVKWTYRSACPHPACGFSMKWEPGSW